MSDQILRTSDAAKLLGITPDGVRWLVEQGRLQSMRTPSGQHLFTHRDVQRLAAQRAAVVPKKSA